MSRTEPAQLIRRKSEAQSLLMPVKLQGPTDELGKRKSDGLATFEDRPLDVWRKEREHRQFSEIRIIDTGCIMVPAARIGDVHPSRLEFLMSPAESRDKAAIMPAFWLLALAEKRCPAASDAHIRS